MYSLKDGGKVRTSTKNEPLPWSGSYKLNYFMASDDRRQEKKEELSILFAHKFSPCPVFIGNKKGGSESISPPP